MNHAHQSPRYQIVENDRKTCDLLAISGDGIVLHKLEDVSEYPIRAKRVAALYTHLIGALL